MPECARAPRVAVVGAFGNGKTTLSTILAKRLGLPRTHGTPMRAPAGTADKSLEECSEPELIQLAIRRFTERAVGEAASPGGFISDGSVLHEWVYAKVRLVAGLHPAPAAQLADIARAPRTALYEEIADQFGMLALAHARAGYDHVIVVPAEAPLAGGNPPISERFRELSDQLLGNAVQHLGIPFCAVTGSAARRTAQALDVIAGP